MTKHPLTAERARELLSYDPETGVLRWKKTTSNRVRVGDIAGNLNAGYVELSIDGTTYRAHRVVWLVVYGVWPSDQVDHKDLDRSNNRLGNLREATERQNKGNIGRPRHNKSGVKGVYWDAGRQKWHAQISANNRSKSLGRFAHIEDARDAYRRAAAASFGEFARLA